MNEKGYGYWIALCVDDEKIQDYDLHIKRPYFKNVLIANGENSSREKRKLEKGRVSTKESIIFAFTKLLILICFRQVVTEGLLVAELD